MMTKQREAIRINNDIQQAPNKKQIFTWISEKKHVNISSSGQAVGKLFPRTPKQHDSDSLLDVDGAENGWSDRPGDAIVDSGSGRQTP